MANRSPNALHPITHGLAACGKNERRDGEGMAAGTEGGGLLTSLSADDAGEDGDDG